GRPGAGRGSRRRRRALRGSRRAGQTSAVSRTGRRRAEGVGDAQRRRLLCAEHRRGKFWDRAGRGDGLGHGGGGQRPGRVPPGAARGRGRPVVRRRRRRRAGRSPDRRPRRRRAAGGLRQGRQQGGRSLRLVGGGPADHACLRDRRGRRRKGRGGELTAWAVVAAALLLVVVLAVAVWAFQTANRLDRLHVRYDLSWQVLDAALARRAVVSRAVAAEAYGSGERCRRLTALADTAERALRSARETAENELSAELASVDTALVGPALIAELADAEARVLLARRFHNDAVRDTLALRERLPVR